MGDPKRYFVNKLSDAEMPSSYSEVTLKQRVEGIVNTIMQNFRLEMKNTDGGLYVGLGGISYMFFHLAKVSFFHCNSNQYLECAAKYIELPLKNASQACQSGHITDKTGFMTGNVGIYAVAAVILRKLGKLPESKECINKLLEAGKLLTPLDWYPKGGDELFVGRAGFLCALNWVTKEIGEKIISDGDLDNMLNLIVESGKRYSVSVKSPLPLMYHYYDTQYLGAAHGLAGILFVMLCFTSWLERNPAHRKIVQDTIDAIVTLQTSSGNFPCAMDELGGGVRPPEDELVHWCHGAPGTVYLMARAYIVFKDEKYLHSALRCGEITWQKGLLKKGPGICHGVAGSGYVFLVLYQVTKDLRYLRRAHQFMNFMYSQEFARARQPDCPFSLFEGLAGTACFAADLLNPDRAVFPFFEIV